MKHNKLLIPAFFTSLVSMSASTLAGPYAGLNVGNTDWEGENTTSFSLIGGYNFNQNWAVEAAYTNFGDVDVDIFDDGDIAKFEADGIRLSVVGTLPVADKFNLFAKVGMMAWDLDVSYMGESGSTDGTDFTYGVGASYAFTDTVVMNLAMDRLSADIEGESANLDTISLGVSFSF